jgi:hypothetical protein
MLRMLLADWLQESYFSSQWMEDNDLTWQHNLLAKTATLLGILLVHFPEKE